MQANRSMGYAFSTSLLTRVILCAVSFVCLGNPKVMAQENLPFSIPVQPLPLLPPMDRGTGLPQGSLPQTNSHTIPLAPLAEDSENRVQLQSHKDLVTLSTRDAPLSTVLAMIAHQQELNIVTGEEVNQRVNVTLNNVRLTDALDAILAVHGYTWVRQNNIITISSMGSDRKTSPSVQGRMVRVFTLNYVLASDVEKVVKGLMSPLGQSFSNKVTVDEQRNAHEQIVVEDVPSYLDRIAEYISQVDIMPRQVVVEANILQVLLKDNNKHGVNFNQLARINRANVTFGTMGLASGVPPATMMRVEGSDLTGLIDLLKSTSDTKTLASPKVSVVNGQKAKISVGGEIGYLLTTATNTSTLQSVAFLEFGVVLTVTPIITEDGQVLLTVAPQVSTGRINATTKLPEKESTEVQTTALLCDGQAIVIGGLIKESTIDGQNKIPFLGDLWFIGRLFQSRERLRERSEIIITLLPRIARPGENCLFASEEDYAQASTPLMDRNLNPVDRRSWEGELPDASKKTRSWNIFSRKKKTTDVPVSVVPAPIFREPEFNSSTYSTTGSTSVPQPPVVLPAANESTIPTSGPPMPY
jgi:type II secretory pathway component GspD/PulD (secretin)